MFKKSIALNPSKEAYSDLGTAYFYQHRYGEAAAAYQGGIKLNDQDRLLWGNLGDALYWTPGKRQDAAAAYHKAIEFGEAGLKINPHDGNALAYVATYYAMLDDKPAAMRDIEKATKLAPDDPDVSFRAALVYNHFGDVSRTLDWLERAARGNYSISLIKETPDFKLLRTNPRFRQLVADKH
jgi:serine/threonine-protein kinase